jgi:hypothetical protein
LTADEVIEKSQSNASLLVEMVAAISADDNNETLQSFNNNDIIQVCSLSKIVFICNDYHPFCRLLCAKTGIAPFTSSRAKQVNIGVNLFYSHASPPPP